MSRIAAFAFALPLAACGRDEPPAPVEQAAAPAPASVAETPVAAAEQLVRAKAGEGVRFAAAEVKDAQGAAIVCGTYEQAGARHRYIAVGGEFAFVEPAMKPGEMDRAFSEFCGTA